MADFISPFWDMYVKVLVPLSLLFCVFVIATNMRAPARFGNCNPIAGTKTCKSGTIRSRAGGCISSG
jgi:hypothetical protein